MRERHWKCGSNQQKCQGWITSPLIFMSFLVSYDVQTGIIELEYGVIIVHPKSAVFLPSSFLYFLWLYQFNLCMLSFIMQCLIVTKARNSTSYQLPHIGLFKVNLEFSFSFPGFSFFRSGPGFQIWVSNLRFTSNFNSSFDLPYFSEQFPRKLFFYEFNLMYCDLW